MLASTHIGRHPLGGATQQTHPSSLSPRVDSVCSIIAGGLLPGGGGGTQGQKLRLGNHLVLGVKPTQREERRGFRKDSTAVITADLARYMMSV